MLRTAPRHQPVKTYPEPARETCTSQNRPMGIQGPRDLEAEKTQKTWTQRPSAGLQMTPPSERHRCGTCVSCLRDEQKRKNPRRGCCLSPSSFEHVAETASLQQSHHVQIWLGPLAEIRPTACRTCKQSKLVLAPVWFRRSIQLEKRNFWFCRCRFQTTAKPMIAEVDRSRRIVGDRREGEHWID